jgi:gas vesicle protein
MSARTVKTAGIVTGAAVAAGAAVLASRSQGPKLHERCREACGRCPK